MVFSRAAGEKTFLLYFDKRTDNAPVEEEGGTGSEGLLGVAPTWYLPLRLKEARMLDDVLLRMPSLFRRKTIERELGDELRFHFEQLVRRHVRAGCLLARRAGKLGWIMAALAKFRKSAALRGVRCCSIA